MLSNKIFIVKLDDINLAKQSFLNIIYNFISLGHKSSYYYL